MQVVAQSAHVVDPDHLAERLEHVQVGMRARLDAAGIAEERGREGERRRTLPDPGGAVQEIRVGGAVGEGSVEQALGLVLLRH